MISIFTQDGLSPRVVVYDIDTPLDLRVMIDENTATITSATLIMALGANTQNLTVVTTNFASGIASYTMTQANIDALSLNLWSEFQLTWKLTFTDGTTTYVRRFKETVFVADVLPEPCCPYTDITGFYSELAKSNAIPSGFTSFAHFGRYAWAELWNWMMDQGREKRPFMLVNIQRVRELYRNWWLGLISRFQAARLSGDTIWNAREAFHLGGRDPVNGRPIQGEVERLKSTLKVQFESWPVNKANIGQEATRSERNLTSPVSAFGNENSAEMGKL